MDVWCSDCFDWRGTFGTVYVWKICPLCRFNRRIAFDLFLAKDDILAERKWAKYVGRIGEYFSMPIYLCHCGIIQILNELTEKGYVVISPYIAPLVIIMASIILSLPYVLIKEQLYQRRMNK